MKAIPLIQYVWIAIAWLPLCSMQLALAQGAATIELTAVDGTRHQGMLLDWNDAGVRIQIGPNQRTFESKQILRMQSKSHRDTSETPQAFLELVDGTSLPHERFVVTDRQATFTTSLASDPITLPTSVINYVQLVPGTSQQLLARDDLDGDRLVIYKKKTGTFDSLDGILGEVGDDVIQFTWDGDTIPVKRSKSAALVYFHAKSETFADPICWLTLDGGTRLPVAGLEHETNHVVVTTSGGLNFSIPTPTIRLADYSAGKLVYLSDLSPQSQKWTPRIDLPQSSLIIQTYGLPRRDQSYTGSPISLLWPHAKTGVLGGTVRRYDKGLALRSRAVCVYRVPDRMNRFVATVGIDPQTVSQGNVTLELVVDKESVWQGEIDGNDVPHEVQIPLEGARYLKIIVDFGKNLDYGDRLHLAEARFTK